MSTQDALQTLNGVILIIQACGKVLKCCAVLLFLATIGLSLWQVIVMFEKFKQYEKVAQVHLSFETVTFPAVTFCNLNPVRQSKVAVVPDLRHMLSACDSDIIKNQSGVPNYCEENIEIRKRNADNSVWHSPTTLNRRNTSQLIKDVHNGSRAKQRGKRATQPTISEDLLCEYTESSSIWFFTALRAATDINSNTVWTTSEPNINPIVEYSDVVTLTTFDLPARPLSSDSVALFHLDGDLNFYGYEVGPTQRTCAAMCEDTGAAAMSYTYMIEFASSLSPMDYATGRTKCETYTYPGEPYIAPKYLLSLDDLVDPFALALRAQFIQGATNTQVATCDAQWHQSRCQCYYSLGMQQNIQAANSTCVVTHTARLPYFKDVHDWIAFREWWLLRPAGGGNMDILGTDVYLNIAAQPITMSQWRWAPYDLAMPPWAPWCSDVDKTPGPSNNVVVATKSANGTACWKAAIDVASSYRGVCQIEQCATTTTSTTTTTTATTITTTTAATTTATTATTTATFTMTSTTVGTTTNAATAASILAQIGVTYAVPDGLAITTTVKESIPYTLADLNISTRLEVGHQMNDTLLWCQYEQKACNMDKDLIVWSNPVLGNCFTFNHDARYVARRAGKLSGLRLILNSELNEYICSSESSGFKFVLHDQNEYPFPESLGFNVGLGFTTEHALIMETVERLPSPYGNCTNRREFERDGGAFYYTGNYSTEACLRSCYQKNIVQKCKCADPSFGFPTNIAHCRTEQKSCVDQRRTCADLRIGVDSCNCPQPCRETTFAASSSKLAFTTTTAEIYGKGTNSTQDITEIIFYFDKLNFRNYKEVLLYPTANYLSDVGGVIGLLIGASCFSVIEVMVFLVMVIGKLVNDKS